MGNNVSCESEPLPNVVASDHKISLLASGTNSPVSTMEGTKRNPAEETNHPHDVIIEMSDDNSTNFPRDSATGNLVTTKTSPADETTTDPLLNVDVDVPGDNSTNKDFTNASVNMGPDSVANNNRGQECGGAVRDVLSWIAQQFFGRILRGLATDVWNNFLRPCGIEMMACSLEEEEGDFEQDEE